MRRAALAALLLLPGCAGGEIAPVKAAKPPPMPRDLPAIPRSFGMEQVTKRRVDKLQLRVYNTGSGTVAGNRVSSMKSRMARYRMDYPVFLVKHPVQGGVLFVPGPAFPGADLIRQLQGDGVAPDAIKWVVLSRLADETYARMFPRAKVIVDAREIRAKTALDPGFAAFKAMWSLQEADLSRGEPYGGFDHSTDLFSDGTMRLLDLSGKSPGTLGLWVSLDEGPVLLAGESTTVLDNHQDLALPAKEGILSLDLYWRRLYQMKNVQLAVPQLVIFPSNDLTPMKLQPRRDVTQAP